MRLTFILLPLILLSCYTQAQDLLVKQNNDSINCRISSVNEEVISYYYQASQKQILIRDVKSFKYKYYIENADKTKSAKKKSNSKPDVDLYVGYDAVKIKVPNIQADTLGNNSGFNIYAYGGVSHSLGKVDENLDQKFHSYYDKLRSGKHIGVDFLYFNTKNWGFGASYNYFSASNSSYITVLDEFEEEVTGIFSDDIKVNSFGFTLAKKYNLNDVFDIEIYTSLMFIKYKNNKVIFDPLKIEGSTFGQTLGILLDVKLGNNVFLVIKPAFKTGVLSRLEFSNSQGKSWIETYTGQERQAVGRIDLALGLKIRI